MAESSVDQPLLTGSPDVMPKTSQIGDPKRRRLRRYKSAPSELSLTQDFGRDGSVLLRGNKVHPSVRKVAILLFLYLVIGTICFYLVRHQIAGKKTNGVLDSVYFCIVTMTSVGYGDLVPNSVATKMLACVFIFSGMALLGLILSNRVNYLVEKQEILLIEALNMSRKFGPVEALKGIQTNRVRNKCITVFILLLVLILVGIVFLATIERLDIVDAFYCVCSTITSLGYGDKSFSTRVGRVFAIFWILISTLCLAQFLLSVAELSTENRQKALVKWILTTQMTNGDVEAADLDGGMVSAAEFALYKLKKMRRE